MATTCFASYDLPIQQRTIHLETKVISIRAPTIRSVTIVPTMVKEHHRQKDFSRPLHVDCSVEYELPKQAKPPQGIQNEPLLMIHPCYFRKIESQRRSLFVNNMPPVITTNNRNIGVSTTSMSRLSSTTSMTHRGGASCTQYQLVQPVMSQQAATPFLHRQEQYDQQLWEPFLPQIPIPTTQNYQSLSRTCNPDTICSNIKVNDRWLSTPTATAADLASRSPDRPEVCPNKHGHHETILCTRKYRLYQRPRRLHPYDVSSSAVPISSLFTHHVNQNHQELCYNV